MAVEENTNGLKFRDSSPVSSYSEKETRSIYSPQDFVIPLEEALHSQEDSIIHAIILPNYMEDIGTLRETLEVLASHRKAKLQYEVGDRYNTTFLALFKPNHAQLSWRDKKCYD